MDKEFSRILDFNNPQGLSKTVRCLIKKISQACSFGASTSLKVAKRKAYVSLIDELANREDIEPLERLALIANFENILYASSTSRLMLFLRDLSISE